MNQSLGYYASMDNVGGDDTVSIPKPVPAGESYDSGAVRDSRTGKGRFDLIPPVVIRRYAEMLERGAAKYSDRNWEKGMPLSRYLDSAFRHLMQLAAGQMDEDHAAAVIFNIGAIIHHRDAIACGLLPDSLDDLLKG